MEKDTEQTGQPEPAGELAGRSDGTDPAAGCKPQEPVRKLDNPLPDPIQGNRKELEFPITDTGDGKWPVFADSTQFDDGEDLRDAREDDFDFRISDADDFDI